MIPIAGTIGTATVRERCGDIQTVIAVTIRERVPSHYAANLEQHPTSL
jgi:hypothetical protein